MFPSQLRSQKKTKKVVLSYEEWHNKRIELSKGISLSPTLYNKDDPTHLNYIYSMTNISAKSFNLPPMQKEEVMSISGNVSGTLATTGTVIGALSIASMIEAFDEEKIKADGFFRGILSVNLSSNDIQVFKSHSPLYKLVSDSKQFLNQWEPEIIDDDISAADFRANLETKYDTDVYCISFQFNGRSIEIREEEMSKPMKDLYKSKYGEPYLDFVPLDICTEEKVPLYYLKLK